MLRGSQDHLEVIEPLGMGKQHEDNAPDCPHTKFAVKRDKLIRQILVPDSPQQARQEEERQIHRPRQYQ